MGLSSILSDTQFHITLMFDTVVCRQTSRFRQSLMHSVVWPIDKLSLVSSAVSSVVIGAVGRCNIWYFANSKVLMCNDMVKVPEASSWSSGEVV